MTVVGGVFRLVIDYDQPLESAVQNCNFNEVDSDFIEKHFPVRETGRKEVELVLIRSSKDIKSGRVRTEIEKRGFRLANAKELCAFAAAYPNAQRENTIVALGSVWRRWFVDNLVPSVWECDGERGLELVCFEDEWSLETRFLAVRDQI